MKYLTLSGEYADFIPGRGFLWTDIPLFCPFEYDEGVFLRIGNQKGPLGLEVVYNNTDPGHPGRFRGGSPPYIVDASFFP